MRGTETETLDAEFHDTDPPVYGAIVENCLSSPTAGFVVDAESLTPNSRGSYPLSFLTNINTPPVGGNPHTIQFLT